MSSSSRRPSCGRPSRHGHGCSGWDSFALAAALHFLLVGLLSVSMTSQTSIYTESGRADIQVAIWLGLLLILLSVPYVLASLVYAVLWAVKLRGRGYRCYPGTTCFLVLGPVAIIVPVLAWLSL